MIFGRLAMLYDFRLTIVAATLFITVAVFAYNI